MKYILSIDQGTTSCRALLFDKKGAIAGLAQKEFTQYFPQPGWVEHDANEIWNTQLQVIKEAISNAGATITDIVSIGITNQRETTVVWNTETGQPIYNAIVWQDRRTAQFCSQLKAQKLEKIFNAKTGLLLDPYFSGTKINWILNNVKNAKKLAKENKLAFGTIDSWLVYKLTNGALHITDSTNASRTLLMNLKTCQWDADLCSYLDIPQNILPQIKSSSEVYGKTDASILGAEVAIAGIAGDQQAALFGQLCNKPGMVKNTYGTGCFMLMQTGNKIIKSKNKLLTTLAIQLGAEKRYALEGSVFIGGAIVQWLRDGLQFIEKSNDVEALSNTAADSDGVVVVPALTGLGAPHWDANAKGTILGLTRGTTKAHIAKASVESIAYQTAEVLQAMEKDSNINVKELRVDGGATVNSYLMQYQANLLQAKVLVPSLTEVTALGAAFLAGLAVGYWKNEKELTKLYQIQKTFGLTQKKKWVAAKMDYWKKAVAAVKLFSKG